MKRVLLAVTLSLTTPLTLAGCGDDAPKPDDKAAKKGGEAPAAQPDRVVSTTAAGPAAPAGPPPDPAREALLAEVRKRGFTDNDFVESDTNRDPFRSFLATFSTGPKQVIQYKILMPKYALEELKLVAIIGPPTPDYRSRALPPVPSPLWRAMFLDPSGVGTTVQRGDHISKNDVKVNRIAEDRIYVEAQEDLGNGKTRTVERAVELHAGEQLPEGTP